MFFFSLVGISRVQGFLTFIFNWQFNSHFLCYIFVFLFVPNSTSTLTMSTESQVELKSIGEEKSQTPNPGQDEPAERPAGLGDLWVLFPTYM